MMFHPVLINGSKGSGALPLRVWHDPRRFCATMTPVFLPQRTLPLHPFSYVLSACLPPLSLTLPFFPLLCLLLPGSVLHAGRSQPFMLLCSVTSEAESSESPPVLLLSHLVFH